MKRRDFTAALGMAGLGLVAAEAMACGIPVIGTNSGTRDFLIDSVTGIVIWRWSWSISKAIRLLMQNEDLRQMLAKNGRRKIEEFSWEALTDRILKHFGH